MLPGPMFEENPMTSSEALRHQQLQQQKIGSEAGSSVMKKCLVLFLGGCTFAEVSALRFLSQQEEANTEFMVATTSVINGNSFIKSLMTELKDPLGYGR